MKNLFILILFFGSTFGLNAQAIPLDTLVADTCCEEGRGCTGSSYCTACKNCSGCKHCAKNGGTCGVCRRVRTTPVRSVSSKTTPVSAKFKKGMRLHVSSPVLNLREAPSASSKILGKLKVDQEVEVMEVLDSWCKVKVLSSQNTGYVYRDYLK
ncbi:SH3 domain-containing protein [Leeuwenhoekiella sp. UBA6783]|uniref:SH3 domain-containing protein n=1 Tax=Leeuwenhoekiella sp. UBA6783 TaxID=1946747 RepID=UPI0025C60E6D|nr:SH3 domain-containing protein [Leeuwenhoekiella sp. UBA6783]|tara:strand:- start:4690 stop:5151 length:462 start_codon:yes stop_codon:yes gene_type:complete